MSDCQGMAILVHPYSVVVKTETTINKLMEKRIDMRISKFTSIGLVFRAALLVAGLAVAASAQQGQPPCSETSGPIFQQVLAKGVYARTDDAGNTIPIPTDFKIKVHDGFEQVIFDQNSQENVAVRICVKPGARFPWHTHPGAAIVLVQSGSLALYDGDDPTCTAKNYGANQAFVDSGHGHAHTARNEGLVDTDLLVLFLNVPVGGNRLITVPNPGNCVSKGL